MCLPEAVGFHGASTVHLAAEARGDVALLALGRGKEYRVASCRCAVGEGHRPYVRTVMIDPDDRGRPHLDVFVCEAAAVVTTDVSRAVGAEDDARRPGLQRERKTGSRGGTPDHGDDLVAMLPAVAVRAMMDRHAIAFVKSGDVREVIPDAAGDERHAGAHFLMAIERRLECISEMNEVGDRRLSRCHAVGFEFLTAQAQELQGWYAIARQEAVQGRRSRVARPSGVAEQEPAPTPGKHESGAQPGWTATDNEDVKHHRLNCKPTAIATEWTSPISISSCPTR